jgi:NADH-quinone oxidoreductase subunit N
LLLVAAGLAIMLVDAFSDERSELALVAAVSLFVVAALAGAMLVGEVPQAPEVVTRYLAVDRLGLFFDVVICVGAGLSALLAGGYLREHGFERGEFYVLIIFTAFGAMVLARAVDLLSIFLGLETMSLGAYALVAYRRTSARAVEGAVKYFLLGSFAAAILLFGSALLYGATGHTDLAGIQQVVAAGDADATLTVLALVMLIVGLAFKVGAVPFHMWVPDSYEGAATPVTTFMSVSVKAAAIAVLVRVLVGAFGDPASMSLYTGWTPVIVLLAIATMLYGNLAALAQTSVKRMLAYSSIAHAGYILVGLAAAHEVGSFAVSSVLYYIAAYTVSNVLAFTVVARDAADRRLLRQVLRVQCSRAGRRADDLGCRHWRSSERGGRLLLPQGHRVPLHARARGGSAHRGPDAVALCHRRTGPRGLLRGEDGDHSEPVPRLGRIGGFEPDWLAGAG